MAQRVQPRNTIIGLQATLRWHWVLCLVDSAIYAPVE